MCDEWEEDPVVIPSVEFNNSNRAWNNNRRGGRGFSRPNAFQSQNWRNFNEDAGAASHGQNWRNSNENAGSSQNQNWRNFNESAGTEIQVPTTCVGRIIGKGGSKITELQSESGAKIIISKDNAGDTTMIKLLGSEEAIAKAQELIERLTINRPRPDLTYAERTPVTQTSIAPIISWKELADECDKVAKVEWAKLPPIKKDFYIEDPCVANMSKDEVAEFRLNSNNIVVSRVFADKAGYKEIPNPVTTFEQAFRSYPEILDEIKKAGFTTPSPIQSQAWPVLLGGEDLIGIAQTGTGKTLAFLLPALIHIEGQSIPREQRGGPSVLIMAPTRELALQIEREVKKYHYRGITAVCVYGGGNRKEQVNILSRGVDIIIATPGRLNDLVQAGYISVKSMTYVVLDEADRMLDMGFEPQIRKVLYDIRPDRQTTMTSATWPPGVRRLADSYMENPVQVYVGSLDLAAVHSVTQIVMMMPDDEIEKFNTFMEFARNMMPDEKVIVFCGKKSRADYLASELVILGVDCQSIHGDREQSDREQALADITDGTVQILIATDVASRGLDIEDITHVVNYDFPRNIEEYVHRVGRTGRAGKTGQSISYFTRADWSHAKELIAILEEAQQYVPEELHQMTKRYDAWKERKGEERGRGGGGGFRRGGGRFQRNGW